MQNLLARLGAMAILGAGFAATGDAGRLADRVLRVVNARTVPAEPTGADAAAAEPTATVATGPAHSPAPTGPREPHPAHDPAAPVPTATPVALPPPLDGPDRVDVAGLQAGDRVVVWLETAAAPDSPWRHPCAVIDIVDPHTGEAVLHRTAGVTRDRRPIAPHVPERIRLPGGRSSTLARRAILEVHPVGFAHGGTDTGTPERIAPIRAIAVVGHAAATAGD